MRVEDWDGTLISMIFPHPSIDGFWSARLPPLPLGEGRVRIFAASATLAPHCVWCNAGAMRINSTLYYTLKDHLGSASVVTDASGNILGENRYYPYGETRLTTGTIFTDKLFTGQREMAGLGIYHYQARFYSPKLGRFLSADTIVPSYANPQSLNRYSYVLGNPLKYTDPTGHRACEEDYGNGDCISYAQKYNLSIKKSKNTYDAKRLDTSKKLKDKLKFIEGYDERPYNDLSEGDLRHDTTGQGQGTCTIGYGTALHDGPCNGNADTKLKKNPISQTTAERWFNDDVGVAEQIIQDKIKVKLTQSQFDALVSFVYNVGHLKDDTVQSLNAGKYYEAALTIDSGPYTSNGGYLSSLEERRHQEATLFLVGP